MTLKRISVFRFEIKSETSCFLSIAPSSTGLWKLEFSDLHLLTGNGLCWLYGKEEAKTVLLDAEPIKNN